MNRIITSILILVCTWASISSACHAQDPEGERTFKMAFNRYYDHAEIGQLLKGMTKTWPEFLTLSSIGKSVQGRELWLLKIENKKTGRESDKAAMYIDANIHGNEIQGAEVCLYTICYLMENYGKLPRITKLVDERVFYILPSANPDGRDHWLHNANTSSSSRSGVSPIDSDRDGQADEDGPNDLDQDGNITRMRIKKPGEGSYKIDPEDARFMIRVKPGEKGDYILLGSEGIDDDGDGRLNEDGLGGYDMNRNNPADWEPAYVQRGAGDFPFSWPETRAIGRFILSKPNIAALQSYHNSGGMILRGPGAATVSEYARADLRIYNELGKVGAKMLPFYRYMIIHKDLYTVHGGFVNFAAEGLGIISFTNELWARQQAFNSKDSSPNDSKIFNDHVMMGAYYKDWAPYKHPEFGDIEIGGWTKHSRRVCPTFMLEETCHRNTAFTLLHAERMPRIKWGKHQVEDLGDGLRRIRVQVENTALISTRTSMAAKKRTGLPDFLSLEGADVLAAGMVIGSFPRATVRPIEKDLSRIRLESGITGHSKVEVEWIVKGSGPVTIWYRAEKATDLELKLP